jgi:hypothetical protein
LIGQSSLWLPADGRRQESLLKDVLDQPTGMAAGPLSAIEYPEDRLKSHPINQRLYLPMGEITGSRSRYRIDYLQTSCGRISGGGPLWRDAASCTLPGSRSIATLPPDRAGCNPGPISAAARKIVDCRALVCQPFVGWPRLRANWRDRLRRMRVKKRALARRPALRARREALSLL